MQRSTAAQQAHRLVDLFLDRPLQHQVRPRVLDGPCLAHDRRAPELSPGPGPELGRADPGEAFRRDARPLGRVHLAGVAETFGHREDGRQGDLGLLGTVVVLELEAQGGAEVLQVADPAGEGAIEQLGHLGAHLPRLPVDGVAAEQHEVEGTGGAQRGSERVCGGQRVGAGERVVAEVQPRVGPPGHRLAQRVIGARWAECHDRAGATGRVRQSDPL